MKIRSLSLLLLVASFAFADTINYDQIFVAPATDISIYYLSLLFGTVSNVLVGGSNVVVGQMFYVFNSGIITFTALLIFYTMTLSVINTAQDGNAMGQKVSTWIVLRIVTGMSLLVPTTTGYSAIQILVMWSVVQGVGFADTIWEQALNTMAQYGGTVVVPVNQGLTTNSADGTPTTTSQWTDQQQVAVGSMLTPDNFGPATYVFRGGVCAMALYQQCLANNPTNPTTECSLSDFGFFRTSQENERSTWAFGKASSTGSGGYGATMATTCALITAPAGNSNAPGETAGSGSNSSYNSYYNQATDNLVMSVGPMAMDFYSSALTTCQGNSDKCGADTMVAQSAPGGGCTTAGYNDAYVCSPGQMIISGASTYYSISMAARMQNELSSSTDWMANATNAGWAMAGSYYYDLVGGGATNQLQLFPIELPTVDASQPVANNEQPYYTVYDAMVIELIMQDDPPPSSSDGPPPLETNAIGWYGNSAYYYLQQMSSISTSPNTSGTGTVATNPQQAAYDEFAGQMINKLNIGNPLGTLGSGKSAYFPYATYGDFTKYPGYIWNLLSSNLASLAGIKLYANTSSDSLFPTGASVTWPSPPGVNGGCALNGSCASGNGPKYPGCFSQLITSGCLYGPNDSPPFSGLLGQASASAQSYLSDPLLSIANTGRFMLQNSMNYWTAVIEQTYTDAKNLAGAYMGVNIATATAWSIIAFWVSTFSLYDVGGAFALLSGAMQAISQFFFSLDQAVMQSWLPFGTSLAMMFFGLGIMMGVYLPFIPFLLYLFGVISWLIAVVEAMVAAPLVAMGVTHPEGHDLLGKSEQALMLLLGVFIRPAAMVLGLILGITLNYIMVGFFNFGFVVTVNPILAGLDGGSFQLVIVSACLIVYVYILIEVINQCFSMIFQVPDKILRWIGGPQEQSSAAQAMQSVKSGVQQSGSQGASGASQSAGSAPSVSGGQVSAATGFDGKKSDDGGGSEGQES